MVFKVGETVVYPHHGAALIEEINTRTIKGEDKLYLKLKVAQGDLTIEVPAENCDLVTRTVVFRPARSACSPRPARSSFPSSRSRRRPTRRRLRPSSTRSSLPDSSEILEQRDRSRSRRRHRRRGRLRFASEGRGPQGVRAPRRGAPAGARPAGGSLVHRGVRGRRGGSRRPPG